MLGRTDAQRIRMQMDMDMGMTVMPMSMMRAVKCAEVLPAAVSCLKICR